jgi:hypothetical protein
MSIYTTDNTIPLKPGETYSLIGSIRDESGNLQDLTGWTGLVQVRRRDDDAEEDDPLLEFSDFVFTSIGVYSVDVVAPEDFTPGKYEWDARFEDADGEVMYTDTADFVVRRRKTKP